MEPLLEDVNIPCPIGGGCHLKLKMARPAWVVCPLCNEELPDAVDLTQDSPAHKLPTRPAPAGPPSNMKNAAALANTAAAPALTISGALPLTQRPMPTGYFQAMETAKADMQRSIQETKKPSKRISAWFKLTFYVGEYAEKELGGIPFRDYTKITSVHKIGRVAAVVDHDYGSHEMMVADLIRKGASQTSIGVQITQTEWQIVASVQQGNGASVTEMPGVVMEQTTLEDLIRLGSLQKEKVSDKI